MTEEIVEIITKVGFPTFVAVYLLVRLEPVIRKLQQSIVVLTVVVAKMCNIDYEEAKKLAGNE